MDRARVSALAHCDHPIAGPLSVATVTRLIERLRLCDGARCLDLGCVPGEWLIRILERYDARGIGVDVSSHTLERAIAAAAQQLPPDGCDQLENRIRGDHVGLAID